MPTEFATRKITATEAALLGLLAKQAERSGYDLQGAVEHSVGYFWAPAKSRIYAVLPGLVDAGLARRREVVQKGRPTKQLYRITRRGRAALRDWLAEPAEPDPDRNSTLLKLFFGEHVGDDAVMLEHVRAKRAEAEALKRNLARYDSTASDPESDRFPSYTRRYGHEWADAVIRWAKFVERDLEARL